jgi:hypothetical protein
MKLQKFYILAAAALLIGAVSASAQTAAFNATAGPFDNLDHDCISKSETGSQVLLLINNDIVVQSFRACADGYADKAYVIVKQTSADGKIACEITDSRGNTLDAQKLVIKEGFNGMVTFKVMAKVESGMTYNMKFRAINTNLVIEGRYGEDSDNTLHLNGWKLDGNISAAVGMREVIEKPNTLVDGRNPYGDESVEDRASEFNANFSVYPNPFSNDFSVKFNRDLKGETTVMLTDLSGNVLHREVRMNPINGQQVYINPVYNLHPGAYALRIINDNRVYTQTLMKQ